MSEAGDLDTLFQAARQIESALLKERTELQQLRKDLKAAQSRHAQEVSHLQQALQQRASHEEQLKEQLRGSQNQSQALQLHTRKLEALIAQIKAERAEFAKKLDLDMQVARAAADHARKQAHQAEKIANEAGSKATRVQAELERAQADALEHDHRYRSAAMNYQAQEKLLHDALNALKDQLKQARAELARYKGSWQEVQHRTQRQQELELKTIELDQSRRGIAARLDTEKQRREHLEAELKSRESQDELFKASARMAEERVAKAEARMTQMATELIRLRSMRTTELALARAERPPEFEFEGLDQLAVTGYPVPHSQ